MILNRWANKALYLIDVFLRQRLTTLVLEGTPVFGSHLPKPSTAVTHEQSHYFQDLNGEGKICISGLRSLFLHGNILPTQSLSTMLDGNEKGTLLF